MSSIISYPDRTLTGSISSITSWQAALPLTNLQDKLLSKKARTTGVAGTQDIRIDLGATARNIKVIALLAHNLSYNATVSVLGTNNADYTSSALVNITSQYAYPQTLGAEAAAEHPNNWIYYSNNAVTPRYWKITITDTGNTAGYIELGRVWLGTELDLISRVEYGSSLIFEARDLREDSVGGVSWGEKRQSRRYFTGNVPNITEAVGQKLLIAQKTLGLLGEFMFVPDTTHSALNLMLKAFPALFREVSPITYTQFNSDDTVLSLQEII